MSDVLLEVEDVTKHFPITQGILFKHEVASVKALDGVSLTVRRGETLGIVGESGCGKSTLARVIMRLLEPTTALDVTTQAQILDLIRDLQAEHGTAVVLITHDLGVVAETADDIVVMYAARVAEHAPVFSLFEQPLHPYTWGLLGSLPRLDVQLERLTQIRGQPPSLLRPPSGCRFRPRCAFAFDRCRGELPDATAATFDPEHLDACFLSEERKRRESARVVAELGLEADAA